MRTVGRTVRVVLVAAAICAPVAAFAAPGDPHGSQGPDRLVGTKSADTLKGFAGDDTLIGGRGRDTLIGGKGNDKLRGGPGRDTYNMRDGVQLAAPGNDRIDARDGGNDEINCGAGDDIAVVDATEDGVYDCEMVIEP
jgi:Ca2+-binding RTX toxin-like protein